jgi:transmembrane sensor
LVTILSSRDRATPVQEAAAWLARLHSEDRCAADDVAFRSWIAAAPENAAALDRVSSVWEASGGLAGRVERAPPRTLLNRRAVLAGSGAAVIAGGSVIGWNNAYAGVYRTAVGEQRRVALADGSRLLLDTATDLRVRMHGDRRELEVRSGRVGLEIATDPRPFVILADGRRTVARGGRLDVRCDGNGLAILVAEGHAEVSGGAAARTLTVGERLRVARAGAADAVDRPNLDDLLAWQSGRAVFRDTTLAAAAEEMNRYTDRKLVIGDPKANALRLSGVYRVGDTAAFANSVAMLLPVRVIKTADTIRVDAL